MGLGFGGRDPLFCEFHQYANVGRLRSTIVQYGGDGYLNSCNRLDRVVGAWPKTDELLHRTVKTLTLSQKTANVVKNSYRTHLKRQNGVVGT